MPLFRGQRVNRNNGSGAGRGDNTHPQPAQPQPEFDEWGTATSAYKGGSSQSAPAAPASGRQRFSLEGGGYIRTTPNAASEGRRHDVTVYSDDHKPQYSVSDASFGHDAETGTAKFFGGKESSSGDRMSHTWTGKTNSGNLHQDDLPF
jgi:hypothetical protein